MRYLRMSILAIAAACMAAPVPALAIEGLSRGHNILLERGLQLQALSFIPTNPPSTGIFNPSLWTQSNFSTIHFWHGTYTSAPNVYGYPADRMPAAPGPAWGMTDYAKPGDIAPSAVPYASQLVSYQYGDEQDVTTAAEMATLQSAMAQMHVNRPNVITYTNQWGTQHSAAQMQTYMRRVQPDMLCFDTYPFNGNVAGGSPTALYRDMQKYRLLGMAGNDGTGAKPVPVGLYTQTFTYSGVNNHIVSESEIRLNNFSAWAFGYKFADSFVYEASDADSSVTPVMFSGGGTASPTAQFYQVAETNRQSRNLGPALVRLINTSVQIKLGSHEESGTYWWGGHYTETVSNDAPAGVPQWNTGTVPYITGISVTNLGGKNNGLPGDVIVGCFKPLDASLTNFGYANDPYFMIVNGLSDGTGSAADCRQQIHLSFDFYTSGISSLLRRSRATGLVEIVPLVHLGGTQYSLDLALDGGTGDLFKFNNGGMFVPEPGAYAIMLSGLLGLVGYGAFKMRMSRVIVNTNVRRPALLFVVLLTLAIASIGCKKGGPELAPVSGKVTYQGKPLPFGSVIFQPESGRTSTGDIQPDGTFRMAIAGRGDGAAVGKNNVRIACFTNQDPSKKGPGGAAIALGKPLIPQKYLSCETSGIEVDVRSGSNDPVVFELK